MTITIAGNATTEALAASPHALGITKWNIANIILAKERGDSPDGVSRIEPLAELDPRIVWTETATDEGVTVTGTLATK